MPRSSDFARAFSAIAFWVIGVCGTPAFAQTVNHSDLWWNPNESGWGLTIADHETQLFAVWYTYLDNGKPVWYTSGGNTSSDRNSYSGDLYKTTGPAYDTTFNASSVTITKVGSISLNFSPPGLAPGVALFNYTLNGQSGTKQIQRQPFGDALPNWGGDLTDIWWNPNESGWGLSLSQHGNNLFGVFFVYGDDGQPLFVVLPGASFRSVGTFSGQLYTTTGPSATAATFDPGQVKVVQAGDATISFDSTALTKGFFGTGRISAHINGHPYVRQIVQQPFGHLVPASPSTPLSYLMVVQFGQTSTTQGVGSGRVVSTPPGINCPTRCQSSFPAGTSVALQEYPDVGSHFAGFVGAAGCAASNCVVAMSQPTTITASFEQDLPKSNLSIQVLGSASFIVGQFNRAIIAKASGGTPPYAFHEGTTGAPLGLTISTGDGGFAASDEGVLSGTPTVGDPLSSDLSVCVRDSNGFQPADVCTDVHVDIAPPPAPQACVYTYSDWSACQANGTQTRAVLSSSPPGCTGTPQTTQSCTYGPPPGGTSYAGSWSGTWTNVESVAPGSVCTPATECQQGTWQATVSSSNFVSFTESITCQGQTASYTTDFQLGSDGSYSSSSGGCNSSFRFSLSPRSMSGAQTCTLQTNPTCTFIDKTTFTGS